MCYTEAMNTNTPDLISGMFAFNVVRFGDVNKVNTKNTKQPHP